jgi:hypothetical protein
VTAGKLEGIQGIVSGRFFDASRSVLLFIELIDIESGTVLGKQEIQLPKSFLPSAVAILPDNYSQALSVLEELKEVHNADNPDFVIKAWSPRGDGGVFSDGEDLVINLLANRDCFIKVYHTDVDGRMKLIFPNRYYAGNSIKAQRRYKIPDETYPFRFELTEPYGTEFIKVIASTLQFQDIEEAFRDMGAASKETISRGLNVNAKKKQVTEALFSYTIIR